MITGLTPTTCMLKNLVTLSIYCIWRQSLIDHDKLINKSEKVSDSDTETWWRHRGHGEHGDTESLASRYHGMTK